MIDIDKDKLPDGYYSSLNEVCEVVASSGKNINRFISDVLGIDNPNTAITHHWLTEHGVKVNEEFYRFVEEKLNCLVDVEYSILIDEDFIVLSVEDVEKYNDSGVLYNPETGLEVGSQHLVRTLYLTKPFREFRELYESYKKGSTNSAIGSFHWFNTLVAKQKRIGEFLSNKTPDEATLRQWGKDLLDSSNELLEGYNWINKTNKDG